MGRAGRRRLHRRTADRRDARPQRPAPGTLRRHRRRPGHHGLGGGRAAGRRRDDRPEVAAAAGPHAADRHGKGPHRLRRGGEVGTRRPASLCGMAAPHAADPRGAEAGRAARASPRRFAARSPAGFRLLARGHQDPDGADGHDRPGGDRLDGNRHADLGDVVQAEAALHLLQAELRPGHQPADRPDPRRAGDEPRLVHRAAAEHPRPQGHGAGRSVSRYASRSSPTPISRRSARSATPRIASTPRRSTSPSRPSRARAGFTPALERLCERAEEAVTSGYNIIILSDRQLGAGPDRDPGSPGDGGGAPSPDPPGPADLRRPGRRVRRAARGAPLLLPRRLRRRGDQPLSRLRHAAEHAPPRRVPAGGRPVTRSSTATSRRSARASSR